MTPKTQPSILFVDDEILILKSLERLFEDEGYLLFKATGGEEALEFLTKQKVTLIVSDYRMPQMDGVTFLEKASAICPDALRIMLTGYADMEAIIKSINYGQVFRFISKPWDEEELKALIRNCIQHYNILEENKYLNEISKTQNDELKNLNQQLQQSLDERAKEIQEKNKRLELFYKALEQSFFETIKLIMKLIEMTNKKLAEHSKRVALYAENIAKSMGFTPNEIRNIQIAALLHDFGKIHLPQEILLKKESELSSEQLQQLKQHPMLGNTYISSIERLKKVSEIILYHHENMDGSGYPFGKEGDKIPVESRILAVCNAYDHLLNGDISEGTALSREEALARIQSLTEKNFDATIVQHLAKTLK